MIAKTFEIRDAATFIPALAVKLRPACEADRYLLARAGFGVTPDSQGEHVLLMKIDGGNGACSCDPYDWARSRTMATAHQHIIEHFDELDSGAVVDVEFLLGERPTPKTSEAHEFSS